MTFDVSCPNCAEAEELAGVRSGNAIQLTCGRCGHRWTRELTPRCPTCGEQDLQTVPLAIVEKGRGTQLSVVGTRPIHLCERCDAETLRRYHRNRPNPLMPSELPTDGAALD